MPVTVGIKHEYNQEFVCLSCTLLSSFKCVFYVSDAFDASSGAVLYDVHTVRISKALSNVCGTLL